MRLSTDFDSGAMTLVQESSPGIFEMWPYRPEEYRTYLELVPRRPHDRTEGESGERDGANFAFHFRLDGCRGRTVVLRFHLREIKEESGTSVVYANPDFPVWSPDGEDWLRLSRKTLQDDPEVPGGKVVTVEAEFACEPVWIAYQYPYSNDHLEVFLERALVSPFCAAETCGTSTEGRPIRLITVTDPEAIDSKKTVWLTGIQHPAETGAGWGIEGAIDYLLSADPGAAQARRGCVFKMVPLVNVDAVAEGRGRLHPQNRNLNREWEKGDPAPEVAGVRAAMERWVAQGNSIDAFIDIHGFSGVTDRNWVLLPLAEGSYPAPLAADLERFEQTLCSRIPFRVAPHPQAGFAAGMAARRFGAQAFSVDGYVFRWPVAGVPPDLAAHYLQGCQVWPLSDLKAAGGELVKAVTEHLLGDDALLRP